MDLGASLGGIGLLMSIISGLILIIILPSKQETGDAIGKEDIHKGFVTVK